MNTAKLHIIAKSLLEELGRTQTVHMLQQAVNALQNQINQPQQPTFQQQLTTHLETLYQKLKDSPVENFSPAWRDAMVELRVSDEFGRRLEDRLRAIFERNTITPQTALDQLKKLLENITGTQTNLTGLVDGLEYFWVGEDELSSDECEVGVIIPRAYVDDNLKKFGEELADLEKTLLVFSELAIGQRQPLTIRNISSSELSVFLNYTPEIGACVAVAVERIVALYKQILEIKKLKKELKDQNVPEESLRGIDEHAVNLVAPELDKLAIELIERYGTHLESGRRNEISIELRRSLNKLANRIDRGFNIELRVVAPEEQPEDEASSPRSAAIVQIAESAAKINHVQPTGEPVLFLPEGKDEKN